GEAVIGGFRQQRNRTGGNLTGKGGMDETGSGSGGRELRQIFPVIQKGHVIGAGIGERADIRQRPATVIGFSKLRAGGRGDFGNGKRAGAVEKSGMLHCNTSAEHPASGGDKTIASRRVSGERLQNKSRCSRQNFVEAPKRKNCVWSYFSLRIALA